MRKAICAGNETGAIVFHIAERHAGLLPDETPMPGRGTITWMFAALSTVEPPILELVTAKFLERDWPWAAQRLPLVQVASVTGWANFPVAWVTPTGSLDGAGPAGDLMMVSVLLRLRASGTPWTNTRIWPPMPRRGEARGLAYQRAFDAQLEGQHRQAVDRLIDIHAEGLAKD